MSIAVKERQQQEKVIRVIAILLVMGATVGGAAGPARAEDGYELWLRYRPLSATSADRIASRASGVLIAPGARHDPIVQVAAAELRRGLTGLTARRVGTARPDAHGIAADGTIVLTLGGSADRAALGAEGYDVRTTRWHGRQRTVVTANSGAGVLYGAFALLRHVQTGGTLDRVALSSTPRIAVRVLDHWDNIDGSVERGYAGSSIWHWWRLPQQVDPRLTDYARANASIGINGAVLNNVNATAQSLTDRHIAKAAAIAGVLRRYGMRVYLSARFSAPIELGGLPTADPLDPAVAAWWRERVDAIYRVIPDFGGFLVKASSEGQPGPGDYGRSHADGANMLAAALAPHHGIVMWRAFVYSAGGRDRARQAYDEFAPLDGKFADNVLLQVKNGPIDFQPREPFHPLFGAMPRTNVMPEFQLTKEYLGFATHLAYLGPLIQEVLTADTFAGGPGSTVARIAQGSGDGHHALTGMAGVANIGSDRDWTGSIFNQANWYAFGRLAWNPGADADGIAREWAAMTFAPDLRVVRPVAAMMAGSREAVVDYMTPLGLAHQMATGHHYGPAPWVADLARPEWNPVYYNRADADGIGFDRTATGSDALAQYRPGASAALAADPRLLLWFHHVGWTTRVQGDQTLWQALVGHYDHGIAAVRQMQWDWAGLRALIDPDRFAAIQADLAVQLDEAMWWRDASIAYWQSLNHLPLPAGSRPPAHALAWYQALRFPDAPGQ